jgi:hypothetical protein
MSNITQIKLLILNLRPDRIDHPAGYPEEY